MTIQIMYLSILVIINAYITYKAYKELKEIKSILINKKEEGNE